VHALLRHLASSDFSGSPRLLGTYGNQEVLSYVHGAAAIAPTPGWALTDGALVSVAELLRDYHQHAKAFDGRGLRWLRPVPQRWRGDLITHNDPNPGNVIFREGHAVALIDFDLAGPGSVEWELALAACFWVPLLDPADVADARAGHAQERLRLLLDSYGATSQQREKVLAAAPDANRWIADTIKEAATYGHPAFMDLWTAEGYRYARADEWLKRSRAMLIAPAPAKAPSAT
jgi:aminoglycoside phosphotransferase (APT) family kinase protein